MGLRVNPTYRQRRFGAEVRRLRERAGLSVGQSAAAMSMNQSHISNVESGRTGLSPERLRALAGAVGCESTTYVDALVAMGQASGKGWWSAYRDKVPVSRMDTAELEAGADAMLCYEPMFVPGLLQTREYSAAIHQAGYVPASREDNNSSVEFRLERQKVLVGEQPPQFHAVVHEAALHTTLNRRDIMRTQLLRLIELSRLPNVTVQVLPFDGPVPFGTSFTLIRPSVAELSTVIVPHIEQSLYLGENAAIARYNEVFATMCEVALPPVDATVSPEAHGVKDSLGLIQRLLYPLL
ncbi:helix-turn-helix domain-containing protein [Streptomyces sp. 110]|uniref:Helix-turn-helix domain-containing protein n=1 Tax=Streptomyces endocoffeicus TaxID=2898945 RepID=A0ABS1PY73_9ACTN|nr:helix-turn-helix transcriptional regulator [Streptomyces endocoffeicus]MBL1117376.1 helix-turn-helix domain-containing protein [Streptomyces endocoffeicus]